MLEYNFDLSPSSYSRVYTPDIVAKSFPFYVTELGYFEAGPGYYTRRDGKNPALLFYTVSGKGELTWKGQTCVLEPGSAAVILCDSYHEYRTVPGAAWKFYWVHLDGSGLAGYRVPLLERLTPVRVERADVLLEHFSELAELDLRADLLSLAEASQCLSGMLLTLLRSLAQQSAAAPLRRAEVSRVAEYILEHMCEPLTTDDFARVANLSRYHFIHLFSQQMGVSPYRYLQQCRVNRAQELLRTTNMSVAEVAAGVGLPDLVNFIRHFRGITGTTPAKYRKESTRLQLSYEGAGNDY